MTEFHPYPFHRPGTTEPGEPEAEEPQPAHRGPDPDQLARMQATERHERAARLAADEARRAKDESLPIYYRRRSQVAQVWPTLSRDQREAAVREGRVIPDHVPIPATGRPYVPPKPNERTYRRSELRDPGFVPEPGDDLSRAVREGRIVDDNPSWRTQRRPR